MTLEQQRKMLGADGDIERDCDRIVEEAARLVLDRSLSAPSITELIGEGEDLDLDDIDKQEVAKAIELEQKVESNAEPGAKCALAQWMERYRHIARNPEEWAHSMLKWYAKASLAGVAAAMSAIGRAFDGWFDNPDMFVDPDEGIATDEDDRLVQDPVVAAACELSAAKRGDSFGLYQWYFYYMGIHDEKVCERNFDKAMECLIRLVERDHEVNKGILHDVWAHQGPHQLELLVKNAPPESKCDNREYAYIFGLCHEHGWVLDKDLNKAFGYYRKAVKFGHAKSEEAARRVAAELGSCGNH